MTLQRTTSAPGADADDRAYASLFLRAAKAPLEVSDEDLARLTETDRKLIAARCGAEVRAINGALRRLGARSTT